MTDRLLPCPFCGNEAELRRTPASIVVGCTDCWASEGRRFNLDQEAEAIAAWNQRAPKALVAEERLGAEFEKVWDDNADVLFEATPLAAEGADPVLVDVLSSILAAQQVDPYRGWNLTKLNKAVDRARELLGLPSVRDLNPDIAAMQDHASANKEGILVALSAITDPTLAREEGYRQGIEDAAKVANDSITYCFNYSPTGYARRISNAIRALAEKAIQP